MHVAQPVWFRGPHVGGGCLERALGEVLLCPLSPTRSRTHERCPPAGRGAEQKTKGDWAQSSEGLEFMTSANGRGSVHGEEAISVLHLATQWPQEVLAGFKFYSTGLVVMNLCPAREWA
ncbi:hypothetical protein NDU88_000705 [Pleurodeles waltl]|uniref:Uncharacterized protein n=1 Tax=Pleurodeles waltl TaxID=8319 RepID=A0AAV7UQQ8_PLEWA|nr:hypothetical protein NDU88_000705 [Pleurodeles waltl]